MRLYFSYADHIPNNEDLILLMSSYAYFDWNQTHTAPIDGKMRERYDMDPGDIFVTSG
jgi:hypothetical protein